VSGWSPEQVGELAAREGVVLHELTPAVGASLEDVFLEMTSEER
jgi:ABC-2 type transport system ATP-binding protein